MADRDPNLARPRIVIEGPLAERAQQLVDREEFETLEEVAEAACEAFEREQTRWNDRIKEMLAESLADPRPGIPMEEAFARLDAMKAARRK